MSGCKWVPDPGRWRLEGEEAHAPVQVLATVKRSEKRADEVMPIAGRQVQHVELCLACAEGVLHFRPLSKRIVVTRAEPTPHEVEILKAISALWGITDIEACRPPTLMSDGQEIGGFYGHSASGNDFRLSPYWLAIRRSLAVKGLLVPSRDRRGGLVVWRKPESFRCSARPLSSRRRDR